MTLSRYGPRRAVTISVVLVLYVAAGVVLPVVHAETEVLRGSVRIERGHSDTCPRIHSDAVCVLVASFQLATDRPAAPRSAATSGDAKPRLIASAPRPTVLTTHLVRAPPSI